MEKMDIFSLITASAPYPEYADQMMLYGQFVGSWDLESTWYDRDGSRRSEKGEWHFTWILDGRGVQDVIYAAGALPEQFGTTLRCYNPKLGVWHVSYMQPSSGEFVHLIGQKDGDRILQEVIYPTATDHCERWIFKDITPKSFVWIDEVSTDNGESWFMEQEMRGTRRND